MTEDPFCPLTGELCAKNACRKSQAQFKSPLCEVAADSISTAVELFHDKKIDEAALGELIQASFTPIILSREFLSGEGKAISHRGMVKAFERIISPEEKTLANLIEFRNFLNNRHR